MVPMADALAAMGAEVVWLTSGRSGQWLRLRYPRAEHHELPSATVIYGPNALWSVVRMMPALSRAERAEQNWLAIHLPELRLNGLISDNRYGLHAPGLPAVLVTHQLAPRATSGLHTLAARIVARKLCRFDAVWVPDVSGMHSLAGDLAVNPYYGEVLHHIGLLSRFAMIKSQVSTAQTYAHVGLVSGPEHHRTRFEHALLARFRATGLPCLIVCGLPATPFDRTEGNVRLVHHLNDEALAAALRGAGQIHCTAGYSTLMDLQVMGLKAQVTATPGQTEQTYLAQRYGTIHPFIGSNPGLLEKTLSEWTAWLG